LQVHLARFGIPRAYARRIEQSVNAAVVPHALPNSGEWQTENVKLECRRRRPVYEKLVLTTKHRFQPKSENPSGLEQRFDKKRLPSLYVFDAQAVATIHHRASFAARRAASHPPPLSIL
jgi:hypothetical protein